MYRPAPEAGTRRRRDSQIPSLVVVLYYNHIRVGRFAGAAKSHKVGYNGNTNEKLQRSLL